MYANICGVIFVGISIFSVASTRGINLYHKSSRNVLSTPARITLKWSLKILIPFLITVCLCLLGGTFSCSIPFLCNALRNLSDVSLLSMCFF